MWIKSSEGLPKKSDKYFIANRHYTLDGKMWFYYDAVHYSAKHKQWNNYDDKKRNEGDDIYEVDYWMPIPEVEE